MAIFLFLRNATLCLLLVVAPLETTTGQVLEPAKVFKFSELDRLQPQPSTDPHKYSISDEHFGFIHAEKQVFFGYGCLTFDLTSGKLECTLPSTLTNATLSLDGKVVFGCLADGKPFYLNTESNTSKLPKFCPDPYRMSGLHSNLRWILESGVEKNYIHSSSRVDIFTRKEKSSSKTNNGYGKVVFSGDGKYIVMIGLLVPFRLIEINSMQWLPIDKEFDFIKPTKIHFSSSFSIARSHDVSMIATDYKFSEEVEPDPKKQEALVIWDRKKKAFLWKKIGISTPIAFSPNNRYLMIKGAVWDWKADKQIATGILGDVGKFSVDGHLLITRDRDAFYLYRLPI